MFYRNALVILLLAAGAAGGEKTTLTLRRVPEADSQLQVHEMFFGEAMFRALLVNASGRAVEEVQLGLRLEDQSSKVAPVTHTVPACIANVPADGLLVVTEKDAEWERAMAHFREEGIADKVVVFGITRVRFAGGEEWTRPLERRDGPEDKRVTEKVKALIGKPGDDAILEVLLLSPGSGGKVTRCGGASSK